MGYLEKGLHMGNGFLVPGAALPCLPSRFRSVLAGTGKQGIVRRLWMVTLVLGALGSLGAQYQTRNFLVTASSPKIAQRFAEWAEYYRKHKAIQWLGKEMPAWKTPCSLHIEVTYYGSGGATTFAFDKGKVLRMNMKVEGTLDRLVASVLPHEMTHAVLGHHFRRPVPRWADEGAAVLSEDEQERKRHDWLVRKVLDTPGRAIPLRRLFAMTEYPRDQEALCALYAQGYSVVRFLLAAKDRKTFLAFVEAGMAVGWDKAAHTHYGHATVEALERAWLQDLRK
jgi:hypothetical protein